MTNCHLVLQELWSFLFVDLCCLQFVSTRHLLIPVFICVFCGDCTNLGYSQYHQSPVRLCRSRLNPGDHAVPFLEYGRVESPRSVNFDPSIPKPGDCGCLFVGVDTRDPPRRHVCPQLSWHDISVGSRFEKQNQLRVTGGGVISVVVWSEDPALEVTEKSASFGESCRSKLWSSWEPRRKIPGSASTLESS